MLLHRITGGSDNPSSYHTTQNAYMSWVTSEAVCGALRAWQSGYWATSRFKSGLAARASAGSTAKHANSVYRRIVDSISQLRTTPARVSRPDNARRSGVHAQVLLCPSFTVRHSALLAYTACC
jgi:hypothetical protein